MRHWLEDTLNDLADSRSTWRTLERRLEALGLTRVIYTFLSTRDGRTATHTNMPAWWQERHVGPGRGEHDPFFQYCCVSYAPTRTGTDYARDYPYLDEVALEYITSAGDAGFRTGLSLPIGVTGSRWVGGFNVGGELERAAFDRVFAEAGLEIRLALMFAHERLAEDDRAPRAGAETLLTVRERECLSGLARGEQMKQIGDRLGISDRTVEFHLANARRKLGATTRDQAVARAVHLRLVSP